MSEHSATVGEDCLIVGSITGDEDLHIFGTVEGNINLTETLFVDLAGTIKADITARSAVIGGNVEGALNISESLIVEAGGTLKASVQASSAVISGVVYGSVNATEYVELTPGSQLIGDVSSPRLIMADGSSLRGRVSMVGLEHEVLPEEESVAPAQTEPRGRSRRSAPSTTSNRRASSYARPSRQESPRRGNLQTSPATSRFTSRNTTTVVEADGEDSPLARLRSSAPRPVDTLPAPVETEAASPVASAPQKIQNDYLSSEAFAELGWNKGRTYLKKHELNLQYSGLEDMHVAYSDYLNSLAG